MFVLVRNIAYRLHNAGIARHDKICVYSENCAGWALTDWACMTLGVVLVPIYPSLPGDQAAYVVNDCGAKVVFCGSEALLKKLEGLTTAKTVLLEANEKYIDSNSIEVPAEFDTWWNAEIDKGEADELATIIYTSGTTGQPKGALLPNRAFVLLCANIQSQLPVDETDLFLSWLPMSHVYERFAGHILPISLGATIAYSGSLATLANDMMEVKPTVLLCVPRFLEATKDRIEDAALKQGGMKTKLFQLALAQGKLWRAGKFAPLHGILDKIVSEKIREKTGGRIKFFVSGGGALPTHVSEFYRAFGLEVLQGYGLTETCAASSLNHPKANRPETIGIPIRGVEFKLAEDGEILIRGYGLMTGYHNLPEATAEAIDSEGWFHSGDIGVKDGEYYKITDRKKDLIILGNGKNVAPQPIENKLRESTYIKEVALFGDGQKELCGLIVPDFERLEKYAKEQGITSNDTSKFIQLPAIRDLFKKEVDSVNKTLADFEKVKRFEILTAPFSVEGGELTPSLKVKRKFVREKYSDLVQGMMRG